MDAVYYKPILVYGLHEEMTNQVELGDAYKFLQVDLKLKLAKNLGMQYY